jgi:hypothetical protein
MLSHQQEIWYRLKQYTHPSWLDEVKFARLTHHSSSMLWNLAYVDLCACFSVEVHAPESITDQDLNALSGFVELKNEIFSLITLCLDGTPQHTQNPSDTQVLVEFLCYCFFKSTYPNVSSRIKIQFSTHHIKYFSRMLKKLSTFDVRVISHLYKSLMNYLHGNS